MLTKTLSEAKKKQRNILIKAMNNDIGSIDSAKDSWNPAQISERAKDISYIRSLVDSWNPAQLNEALKTLDLPVIDTWNPAQIEEQRRNLVFYLAERTLTGNPITLNILGNLTPEVTSLKVTMNPIQDLSHGDPSPTNICPISGRTEASVTRTGKNLLNDTAKDIGTFSNVTVTQNSKGQIILNGTANSNNSIRVGSVTLPAGGYTLNGMKQTGSGSTFFLNISPRFIGTGNQNLYSGEYSGTSTEELTYTVLIYFRNGTVFNNMVFEPMIRLSSITDSTFEPYQGETNTHQYSETIYGGTDDFVNGGATIEWGYIASYDGETLPGEWMSDRDVYAPDTTPSTGAEVAYRLETPTTISTTAEEITLLKGTNMLSTDGDSIELKYKQNF